MDRFIGATLIASTFSLTHLKSNMDRFIDGHYQLSFSDKDI